MKIVFYTNSVSPHQLPLAQAIVKLVGADEYRYVYTTPQTEERRKLGWGSSNEPWIVAEYEQPEEARKLLLNAKVLMSGVRDLKLFNERAEAGLTTIYCSERWFKPSLGMLRLLRPRYLMMAWRFARLLRKCDNVMYYPMGIHAARDMARLSGLFAGDLRCLFRAPELDFEKTPGGNICLRNNGDNKRYCLDKMRIWGYFVETSKFGALPVEKAAKTSREDVKVLWVGRLLYWKRVDTIIRAVCVHANLKCDNNSLPKIILDIYGTGVAESRLKKLAQGHEDIISFHPPVPIDEVRKQMRSHDVYVMSSNEHEGWGAVVSEALEEGMKVIGTYAAGSSATMFTDDNLFMPGDWQKLSQMLCKGSGQMGIGEWTASFGAALICKEIPK